MPMWDVQLYLSGIVRNHLPVPHGTAGKEKVPLLDFLGNTTSVGGLVDSVFETYLGNPLMET